MNNSANVLRCNGCGKFVKWSDIEKGATQEMITPDSHVSEEKWETVCAKCNAKEAQHHEPSRTP